MHTDTRVRECITPEEKLIITLKDDDGCNFNDALYASESESEIIPQDRTIRSNRSAENYRHLFAVSENPNGPLPDPLPLDNLPSPVASNVLVNTLGLRMFMAGVMPKEGPKSVSRRVLESKAGRGLDPAVEPELTSRTRL
ncbi:hypothetical protein EVAR_17119_1 [Eumeta japonica]|uniref:Uncharacterized protein n=1 Tax=Eumeta variegata TaxID=151549 RepID=A0A4C1UMU3_EUMVA|nr:hypothetical protein EVAR_17119_1 [Eumeta japonica]